MIRFDVLEADKERHRLSYLTAQPFPHLIVDDFCDADRLAEMVASVPELENKSRDYIFAGNKFEKSNYRELGPLFDELYEDLRSDRMNEFLRWISCRDVFVDPANHGGGLHQGKSGSFLDMHVDFNYHPMHDLWYREFNLLLYLNRDWRPEWGGNLRIEDLRTGVQNEFEVPFNRMIFQQCAPYTLHGYDPTSFPEGVHRTSIATYAYSEHTRHIERPRTTDWHPDHGAEGASKAKMFAARHYNTLVQAKNRVLGSGTAKNQ